MQLVKDSWIHSIINHPKWAVSWCALLCCLGWQAATQLQVRQFPLIPSGMIRLVATYPGADAQLIQNSVTTVLQRAIGQADSFDYIQATTTDGGCQINAYLPLGADIDRAFPSVLAQVQSVKSSLPPDLNDPVLTRARVSPLALMYVAYVATEGSALNQSEIYQYLNLVIRPQLLTVPGVGEIN
ncbi:MAG: hypothetical protein FJ161_01635, partial [Gammaproteobacteria bacterium]|nr:hypothetical protein [Gammaproteobacteria bacterium]